MNRNDPIFYLSFGYVLVLTFSALARLAQFLDKKMSRNRLRKKCSSVSLCVVIQLADFILAYYYILMCLSYAQMASLNLGRNS